jgi:predicted nucleic acid-binding protein
VSYLLDTNTVSELAKTDPSASVVDWVQLNHDNCFLSSVTVGEIIKGIELLPEGKKRRRLANGARFLLEDYRDRILAYDESAALEWGRLYAAARRQSRVLPLEDSLIEAIAISHNLTVVTQNVRDFFRVPTLNPWTLI